MDFRAQVLSSLVKMGYPAPVAEKMIDRADSQPNSAYHGNDDPQKASRQIIESWYKVDNDEYHALGYTNGIKYGNNWLVPYY